jgi:hypothetical protein
MTEYRQKSNQILRVGVALAALGIVAFAARRGLDSALAFAATASIGLISLWVLARGLDILSEGKPSKLKGVGFVIRFAIYAAALSAIIRVYPDKQLELFFGIFLSVLAPGIEALIESYRNART